MPVVAADILFKFSVAAAAGDTTGGTAATSLGDQISTTQITDNVINNLFDDITAVENAASEAEYRGFFIHNNHATLAAQNVVVWIQSEVALGASVALSIDTTGITVKGLGSAQMKTIADENTAPATQTFSSACVSQGTALSIGTIPAGSVCGIWIRRTAANNAALASDGATLRYYVETAP